MSTSEAVLAGIALAAAAGFRAFLPLLAAGLIMRMTDWNAPPVAEWVASDQGLLLLTVASIAEVLSDKIPVVDNALDAAYTLLKPLAAFLVAYGLVHEVSPGAAWVIGLVIAVPAATSLHLTKAGARGASTALTGGTANPLLSFLEDLFAIGLVVLAIVVPIVAVAAAVALVVLAVRRLLRRWQGHVQPSG